MKQKKWNGYSWIMVLLSLVAVGFALFNYNKLPDQLPIHFGVNGEADDHWSKAAVIAFTGGLGLLLPVLFSITRRVDPKWQNYPRFETAAGIIRLGISAVINGILVFTVCYGLGYDVQIGSVVMALLGILFMVIGNYMPQLKDNYFIGIKTPWTLSNPEVWRRTHRFSGRAWVVAGLLMLIGAFLTGAAMITLLFAAIALSVVLPFFYSLFISRQLRG